MPWTVKCDVMCARPCCKNKATGYTGEIERESDIQQCVLCDNVACRMYMNMIHKNNSNPGYDYDVPMGNQYLSLCGICYSTRTTY